MKGRGDNLALKEDALGSRALQKVENLENLENLLEDILALNINRIKEIFSLGSSKGFIGFGGIINHFSILKRNTKIFIY